MGYEGEIVLNYRLTKKLGEGGFGAVYLAEHVDLGRRAACKVLHPQYAREPSIVERFFREARAVCAIGHKAIVQIENFGALPAGEPFYLMEYFAGRSLQDECKRRALTADQLVAIFDPVADALAAAHARSIIHRDLKPDNIMVRFEGERVADVRLLDFGIAKLLDVESGSSVTGSTMGTPNFMAPEQAIDAKNVDVRADVYSFAATVYAAIAGRPPFVGSSIPAIMVMVQMDAPPPLRSLVPEAPEAVEALIARCLAKSRDYRPPTVAACWAELRAALLAHPMVRAPMVAATDRDPLSAGVEPTEASDPGVATPNERPAGTSAPPTRAGKRSPGVDRSAPTSGPHVDRSAPTSGPPAHVDRGAPTSASPVDRSAPTSDVDRSSPTAGPNLTPAPAGRNLPTAPGFAAADTPVPAPRRSKLPLVVGLGGAAAIGGVVAVVLATRGSGDTGGDHVARGSGEAPAVDAAGRAEPDAHVVVQVLAEAGPPDAPEPAPPDAPGPPQLAELTPAQLETTLAAIRRGAVASCDGRIEARRVDVKLVIDARGRASPRQINFTPANARDVTAFADCIEGVLARTPFPASRSGGVAETRIVFPDRTTRPAPPPDAGVPPVDAPPAKPSGCSEAAFEAIASSKNAADIEAAMRRLPSCGFDMATLRRIRDRLVSAM